MAELIITVPPNGQPKVEVKGVKGRKCLDITKPIEAALGQTTDVQRTKEFYESVGAGSRAEVRG